MPIGKSEKNLTQRTQSKKRSGDSKTALEEAEEEIGEEGEEGGGNGAGEDEGIADESHTAEDEGTEAARADGGSDGGDADGDDGGGSDPGKNNGERERKPDAKENLRASHAHGFGGFQDGGIDTGEPNIRVAKDGKNCVQDERDDGGALADAADERNGNEKTKEGEARDGLENAGDAERDGSQSRTLHDEHAKRNANEDGDSHRDDHQRHVIQSGTEDFASMLHHKSPRVHAEAPGATSREAVNARTSG